MAIEWFRSWHGAPTDSKWLVIARRAGVEPGIVSAVFWSLLDHASQHSDRGSIEGFDVETYSAWSGFTEEHVTAILDALTAKGIISDNRLTEWSKRQPARERESQSDTKAAIAARVRKHRANKNHVTPVTASNDQSSPPQTTDDLKRPPDKEKDSDLESKKQDAPSARNAHAREEPTPVADLPKKQTAREAVDEEFEREFYPAYPHKVGKPAAKVSYFRARAKATKGAILAGLAYYVETKPADRQWLNPATFLNQERFNDRPTEPRNGRGREPNHDAMHRALAEGAASLRDDDQRPPVPQARHAIDARPAGDDRGGDDDLEIPTFMRREAP